GARRAVGGYAGGAGGSVDVTWTLRPWRSGEPFRESLDAFIRAGLFSALIGVDRFARERRRFRLEIQVSAVNARISHRPKARIAIPLFDSTYPLNVRSSKAQVGV